MAHARLFLTFLLSCSCLVSLSSTTLPENRRNNSGEDDCSEDSNWNNKTLVDTNERKRAPPPRDVFKKITILIGDDESSSLSTDIKTDSGLATFVEQSSEPPSLVDSVEVDFEPKYHINETTKLILVDEANESGLLIGELNSDPMWRFNKSTTASKIRPDPGKGEFLADRFQRNKQSNNIGSPTNYSLFLVSKNPKHIAILIDIQEMNFEPAIGCENQEVAFNIVGVINEQLLTGDNSSEVSRPEENGEPEDQAEEEEEEDNSTPDQSTQDQTILPASEAMTLVLNAPLNRTMLKEPSEENSFRVIDLTIDRLYEETCLELRNTNAESAGSSSRKSERNSNRRRKKSKKRAMRSRQHPPSSPRSNRNPRARCPSGSEQFKDAMYSKLNEYLEWDPFLLTCGITRQIIVPMRSVKLSIFSDEFSPTASFKIRYKFVSNPNELPGLDSGSYFCRNRNVIDLDLKCDGVDDCGDASDESIKVCGYPTGRPSQEASTDKPAKAKTSSTIGAGSGGSSGPSYSHSHATRRKLTYVNGDILHCCQPSDWLNLIPQSDQASSLQSLIGDSMNLFSGPMLVPARGKKRVKRIVGGGVAPKGQWPGQASLQYELMEPICHFCAGTLIHPQYVLTAGHCISRDGLSRGIKAVFGAHDLRQQNGSHVQVRYVDDALIFPGVDVKNLNFDWENDMSNDIAILRLNAPVLLTPHVTPACLPPFNTPLKTETKCSSIGWGQTHGSGNSNLLKQLSLRVVNSTICSKELIDRDNDDKDKSNVDGARLAFASRRNRFAGDFESASLDQYSNLTMICLNSELSQGICQGDSGGPLYSTRTTKSGEQCNEIYGVASFIIQYATVGAMCAVQNLPGIFAEVSSKTEWISSSMKMFEQTYRIKYS